MKRISWKRGMRLTDGILRASDACTAEVIGKSLLLASGGRFGLIPSNKPFELTLNIGKGVVDVESVSCLAVTKNGDLIDAQYDTRYTNNFDTRVQLPDTASGELILTINTEPDRWNEVPGGFVEPVYTFSLVAPDTTIPGNAVPIGRIVDDNGWRMDDAEFVPPCLLVASHPKYVELQQRFVSVLAELDGKVRTLVGPGTSPVISLFWPLLQQVRITMSKETDMMTPMTLLSNVQKCVSAFTCACELNPSLQLAEIKMFRSYVYAPYTYEDAYQRIKVGMELCFSINRLVDNLGVSEVKPQWQPGLPAPSISDKNLKQNCTKERVNIPVNNPTPGAQVFYSTDGSDPNRPLPPSGEIMVANGFKRSKVPEMDQTLIIKLKAVHNGTNSEVATFNVTLHKDYTKWGGRSI